MDHNLLSNSDVDYIHSVIRKRRNDGERVDVKDIYIKIYRKKFERDPSYYLLKWKLAEFTQPEYENHLPIIDECLTTKKYRWKDNTIVWKQWRDVEQDVKIHLFLQWYQYDKTKPLKPWIMTIVDNQVFNIKRNIWGKFAKPCASCDAALPSNMCKLFTYQSEECPQYNHWQRTKETAYNLNNAVSMDLPSRDETEISLIQSEFKKIVFEIEEELKLKMTPREGEFYELYFIQNLSDDEVVEKMKLMTPTDGSKNKTVKNFERSIGVKAAKILKLK